MAVRRRKYCALKGCKRALSHTQTKYCSINHRRKDGWGSMGRMPVIGPKEIAKLETGLQNGFSVRKACELAGISYGTYYEKIEKDEKFKELMEAAKDWPTERARQVIVQKIDEGDRRAATWWLERKRKKEFSARVENTGPEGGPVEHEHSVIYRPAKLPKDYWKQPSKGAQAA